MMPNKEPIPATIPVVEDEALIRQGFRYFLEDHPGESPFEDGNKSK